MGPRDSRGGLSTRLCFIGGAAQILQSPQARDITTRERRHSRKSIARGSEDNFLHGPSRGHHDKKWKRVT